jgi:4'-phosphopantetheinyl transferase
MGAGSAVLGCGDTHVCAFSLDLETSILASLESLLSPDEIARANRFRLAWERARFVAGRARLRQIVGHYMNRAPESLRFDYSPTGKPSMAPSKGQEPLRFNATGSEALALVVLRMDADVGVDIERIRHLPDAPALAKRMLSADEYGEFTSIPEELQQTRFFEYWTRKEALAKALGSGLQQGFDRLSLHPWPGDKPQRIDCSRGGETVPQWVMPIAVPRKGYIAAHAAAIPFGLVRVQWWDPRTTR